MTAGAQFGPSRPLLGVWFDRQGRGLVVGANGQVFRSADAGRSWRSAARNLNNPDALHYNAIVADDRGELFVAGEAGTRIATAAVAVLAFATRLNPLWLLLAGGVLGFAGVIG